MITNWSTVLWYIIGVSFVLAVLITLADGPPPPKKRVKIHQPWYLRRYRAWYIERDAGEAPWKTCGHADVRPRNSTSTTNRKPRTRTDADAHSNETP